MRLFSACFVPSAGESIVDEDLRNRRLAMRTGRLFLAVLGLSLGFSFSAVSAFAQDNVCLRSQWIYNWEIVDDKTLIVTDRRDQQYKLGLVGVCTGCVHRIAADAIFARLRIAQ
jgi:hypothetical protein